MSEEKHLPNSKDSGPEEESKYDIPEEEKKMSDELKDSGPEEESKYDIPEEEKKMSEELKDSGPEEESKKKKPKEPVSDILTEGIVKADAEMMNRVADVVEA